MQDTTSGGTSTRTAETEVDRLSRRVEELEAAVEALSTRPDREAKRSVWRRRGRAGAPSEELAESPGLVSRRRLFGLLGGAAAAGAGLAVAGSTLGADSAGAADNDPVLVGTSNQGSLSTTLTSTGGTGLIGISGALHGIGVRGECDSGTGAAGVLGVSSNGHGVVAIGTGGLAPLLLTPGSTSGHPTTDTHLAGELFVDVNGTLFTCTAHGTPGTWADLSTGERLVALGTPARVYDSRFGQLPSTGPKSQITNGTTVSIDVTGPKAGGGVSGVPSGATSVLGNITMVNGPNTTFLTVFAAGGSTPSTSNVNALGGQVIANNFTSQIGTSDQISIQCGFGPTDFIIDIFGYYQ
jgi:hypothetical protein